MLKGMGYWLIESVCDSRCHGSAQRRTRWWGIAVLVEDTEWDIDDSALYQTLSDKVHQILNDIRLGPGLLTSVLMKPDCPDLAEWQALRIKDRAARTVDDEKGQLKLWPQQHFDFFREHDLRHPPVLELHYTEAHLAHLRSIMTARMLEIVLFFDLTRGKLSGDDEEEVIDLSQMITRVRCETGGTSCCIPRSQFWLRKACRFIEPSECLALQGMPLYGFHSMSRFPKTDLCNLAGNAFSAHTAMACTIAALTVLL